MQVTGTLQAEAWQRAEFPPVEEVTSGMWSVPVPIIGNPLRYVLTYLIEHDSGFVMVDPGWNHPDSWQALTAGLDACEIPLTAVTAVLVTHAHPDHHEIRQVSRDHLSFEQDAANLLAVRQKIVGPFAMQRDAGGDLGKGIGQSECGDKTEQRRRRRATARAQQQLHIEIARRRDPGAAPPTATRCLFL